MKTPIRSCSRPARFFGIALSLAASLFACGTLMMPAVAAAADSPVVAQQPLTIQPSIPPNIMLMLDDSGSMAWSIMPDYSFLADNSLDGMRDSAVNGVYYDPAITYSPPPQADSSQGDYQDNDDPSVTTNPTVFPNAYSSPFSDTSNTQDVTKASGKYGNSGSGDLGTFNFYDSFYKNCDASGNCTKYALDTTGLCQDPTNGVSCTTAFAYTTGSKSAGYLTHYVASDCTNIPSSNCVNATDTSGTSAPSGVPAARNVMNWYSYYSSRIKMAQSGVMTAFSNLGDDIRVGFGSINGTAASWISSNITNKYSFSTPTKSANYLAEVQPFGDGTSTSTSTSQRANLWTWLAKLSPEGNTPLRYGLNAIGQYYNGNDSTTPASNAWDTLSSDPNYVAGGTNDTQVACRQAYTILTTDGFWNQDFKSSAITGASDTSGDASGLAVTGPNNQSYTYNAAAPYSGGDTSDDSPSLADVAMYYWKNDLQSGIENEVPTSTDDPAFWQHMVTFTM